MIVEKLMERISGGSKFTKLILGSMLTALAISLGVVGILRLLGFSVNGGIPAAFAAIGAAIYAVRMRD